MYAHDMPCKRLIKKKKGLEFVRLVENIKLFVVNMHRVHTESRNEVVHRLSLSLSLSLSKLTADWPVPLTLVPRAAREATKFQTYAILVN